MTHFEGALLIGAAIVVLVLATLHHFQHTVNSRRMRLARQGETKETFVLSFEEPGEMQIAALLYDEISAIGPSYPLRKTDRLNELGIADEDFDEICLRLLRLRYPQAEESDLCARTASCTIELFIKTLAHQ